MHHLIAVRTIKPTLKSALELYKPKPPQFIYSGSYEDCVARMADLVVDKHWGIVRPNDYDAPIYSNDDWTYWLLKDKS